MSKLIKALSLVLIAAMMLPLAAACKKDPGNQQIPEEPEQDPMGAQTKNDYVFKIEELDSTDVLLTDWKDASYSNTLKLDTQIKSDGEPLSLCWQATSGASSGSLKITDWTEYDAITLNLYSHNACNAVVQVRFSGPNVANTNMAPYYRFVLTVDWEGWKKITVNFNDLAGNYSPNLAALNTVNFDCSGWELSSNSNCILNFGYMYLSKINYKITPSIEEIGKVAFDKAKDNWRELLAGTPSTNTSGTENVNAKIASVNKACASSLSKYDSTFQATVRDSLFGYEIVQGKAGDEAKISSIYSQLYNMALGYATYGSDYYQDTKLFSKVKSGLDYVYKFYYGPNVWEQGTYGNWWYWDIGVPLTLTKILLLLEDRLGSTLVKKYLEPFDFLNKYPTMTACNKTWVTYCVFASALLQNDAERMLLSQKKFVDVFDYVSVSDGFYTDGSFIQHGKHPYTGGYALSMLTTLTDIMYVLHGTRFEIIPELYPEVDNQYKWVFENFQPVIYNGGLFAGMRGREVFRNTSEQAAGNTAVYSLIKMAQYAPADVKAKLESLLKHYFNTGSTNYVNGAPIALSDYTAALKNNAAVQARSQYNITHIFGMMDRVVHHNSRYAASVSLNSTRIYKYEAINNENMDGWYIGDGMIYIYTDGYDFNYNFFNYSDPYKMPGTTVTDQNRKQENLNGGILNGSAFAGGVSIGEYGISVYDQVPAQNKYFDSKLNLRQSYFFFDDEIVALGTGIKDTSGASVRTIVENRLWRDNDSFYVNGAKKILSSEYSSTDVKTMHFSNMGGYVFLDNMNIKYRKADGTADFLEIWIEHGKNPNGASYSYVYLPEATTDETEAYQAAPDIEIISETDKIHAVKEKSLGITGYAFYEAGSCNGVTTNAAVALMVKEGPGGVTVSVSDPTHLLTSATVTVELSSLGSNISAPENITASVNGKTLTLTVDFTGNVGESFTVNVK